MSKRYRAPTSDPKPLPVTVRNFLTIIYTILSILCLGLTLRIASNHRGFMVDLEISGQFRIICVFFGGGGQTSDEQLKHLMDHG
jgi:hypothetical protein